MHVYSRCGYKLHYILHVLLEYIATIKYKFYSGKIFECAAEGGGERARAPQSE